ncbi:hypothetical protein [Nisaea sediminum]|uniref:hypothetical protein n=1 Tax=Nisaea sediminum TaxID=2775867 RepID=UPI001867654B|nr:hypothetical protein [Nisaea sediminum]
MVGSAFLTEKRAAFMTRTATAQPTLDQWKKWEDEASVPTRHRQDLLPGLDDRSLRRGFRRKRTVRVRSYIYSCQRRRPGRESRWSEKELRETDSYAHALLPSPILEEAHFSPADRRVLLALILLSRGRETWTMYMAPLANMARVARSTAHLSVARLVRAGYVSRYENRLSGARNGPNTWTILDARLLLAAVETHRNAGRSSVSGSQGSSSEHRVQEFEPVKHVNIINNKGRLTAPNMDRPSPRIGADQHGKAMPAPPNIRNKT